MLSAESLAIVLCVAAVTTVVFQRLGQPVVLGYLLAGVVVGPHLPIPLEAHEESVHAMSEFGVILLMFGIGLELSVRTFLRVARTAGLVALVNVGTMLWAGYLAARALGWAETQSIVAGAILSISSTTIIIKAFDESRVRGAVRELVLGVLIVEDLIAIVLLAAMTALGDRGSVDAMSLARTASKLALFLVGMIAVGMLVVPRAMRAVVRLGRDETTLIAAVGVCFASALITRAFGYSVALGAFVAGSLVCESGVVDRIEPLVRPVRDLFAAVFFVSAGMMIDPQALVTHWQAIALFTLIAVVGKILGVTAGAFVVGSGVRTSIFSGFAMAQIGEFSFILASLAVSLGIADPSIFPVAVAVSAITTLVTPWLIRAAPATAALIDRKLPRPAQTFVALYGTWIERLSQSSASTAPPLRRAIWRVLIDLVILLGISFAARSASVALRTALLVAALFFVVGVVRGSRRVGDLIAHDVFPSPEADRPDFSSAPRRVLIITLQIVAFILVALPLLAITRPLLPAWAAVALVLTTLTLLMVRLWRGAQNLHGHVRAAAQVVVDLLAAQSSPSPPHVDFGFGAPVAFVVPPASLAAGSTLGQLNLRAQTGATVLAIRRTDGDVPLPTADAALFAGDTLALAGTHNSIEDAIALLRSPRAPT